MGGSDLSQACVMTIPNICSSELVLWLGKENLRTKTPETLRCKMNQKTETAKADRCNGEDLQDDGVVSLAVWIT